MTQRKSGASRVPAEMSKNEKTNFPRPDAKQADQGGPTHERADERSSEHARRQDDDAHGYTQDSGYQGSGGHAAPEGADKARAQASASSTGNGHTHSDQEIRRKIQERLMAERAPRARHLVVTVGTGVVTLHGEVDDELERKRLTDLVRDVSAVRELRDELTTRSPEN